MKIVLLISSCLKFVSAETFFPWGGDLGGERPAAALSSRLGPPALGKGSHGTIFCYPFPHFHDLHMFLAARDENSQFPLSPWAV